MTDSDVTEGESGVAGLLRRVLGDRADEFDVIDAPATTGETFQVTSDAGRVVLAGSTPVAQAAALRAYLTQRCGTQVTVDAPWPMLPERLPDGPPIRHTAAFRHRYHFNVVTAAYTTLWWDWPRWERELDRLAMAGVNLPLLLTGHEAVLQRVFSGLAADHRLAGLDDERLRTFLGGPAYLPFVTMGCLAGWDGPMPQSWIDQQAELGARVIARARELGMRPVLPAFAGHVPPSLGEVASTRRVEWTGFTTHMLDPGDRLFTELGERYVRAAGELFGATDHVYAADPFIEAVPPVQTAEELAAIATAVYQGMRRGDKDALWVLQSWPFTYQEDYWTPERIGAFLSAVPDDRMLLLDLWSEHRPVAAELDTGKPWVWCMLHNFGGRPGMYGKLDTVASAPAASGAAGLGATMEDFQHDPVGYELLADVTWRGVVDLDEWLVEWVDARYPALPDRARGLLLDGWQLLRRSVYAATTAGPSGAVLLRRPVVSGELVPEPFHASEAPRWTSVPTPVQQAWQQFLDAAALLGDDLAAGTLGRDLADVSFVVVGTLGNAAQRAAAEAYTAGDLATLTTAGARLLASIDDLELLLATRGEYLLGRWLAGARRWGSSAAEADYYEADARRLITVWGTPDGGLVDYSRRGWAGLVGSFYRPRWARWVDELTVSLREGVPADAAVFDAQMRAFEARWVTSKDTYPTEPVGNTFAVARQLHERWA